MKAAGWSQAEVARRLRITPGAVSQLCSGKTHPHPGTLNLLKPLVAPALKSRASAAASVPAPWEGELLEPLRRLSDADRQRLLAVFQDLIKAVQAAGRRAGRS